MLTQILLHDLLGLSHSPAFDAERDLLLSCLLIYKNHNIIYQEILCISSCSYSCIKFTTVEVWRSTND